MFWNMGQLNISMVYDKMTREAKHHWIKGIPHKFKESEIKKNRKLDEVLKNEMDKR